ncbi:MAG TPA: orotidine-5'-phosphate decarboxylase [Armatimonadota bacterium]|nr:orotidine-5'-phosphate decarboxylase [Armatimonadota bacterium]
MINHFADRLAEAVTGKSSRVCVGIDPVVSRIANALDRPADALESDPDVAADAIWEFNQRILDAVRPYCGVVKPQSAFYEIWGPAGAETLRKTIARATEMGLFVILDAKRNDIASTAAAYARAYLGDGPLAADALTVNAYLGSDGIRPFTNEGRKHGRGVFALVKTSNRSSVEVQSLTLSDGRRVHEHVGSLVEEWGSDCLGECGYSDVGAVVGATFPAELEQLREAMPRTWFLVPGYGTQGGTADDVVGGFDRDGLGAVVNSSSGILYAFEKNPDATCYADAAATAAREMQEAIETAREAKN